MVSVGLSSFMLMMVYSFKDIIYKNIVSLDSKMDVFQGSVQFLATLNKEIIQSFPSNNLINSNPSSISRSENFWSIAVEYTSETSTLNLKKVNDCMTFMTFDNEKIFSSDNTVKVKKNKYRASQLFL